MNFTFGIITSNQTNQYIRLIVDSIKRMNIPNCEIIIVGESSINDSDIKFINFDETIKNRWITRKKNLITQNAIYENIVYIHDYIEFDNNWYSEFLKFGNEFQICSTKTLNSDGSRYRDWILLWDAIVDLPNKEFILPYNETRLSKFMYINGSYWIAKKYVMEEYPLDENLIWGEGEDVVWSRQVSEKYDFSINEHSIVKMLKFSGRAWNYMSDFTYNNYVLPFIKSQHLD